MQSVQLPMGKNMACTALYMDSAYILCLWWHVGFIDLSLPGNAPAGPRNFKGSSCFLQYTGVGFMDAWTLTDLD